MESPNLHDTSLSRSARRWLLGGSLVPLALILFWCFRPSAAPDAKVEPEARGASAPRAPYQNRALFPGTPGSPVEPKADTTPVIRGVLLGDDGAEVAGATVVAKTFEVAGNLATTVSSALSDEHGRFELRLQNGTYYIHAAKEGYGPTFVQARSGDDVSLVMTKSGIVEGHVRDERGAPVTRFTIDVISVTTDDSAAIAPLWSKTFDSPDGTFRVTELPSWKVTIRATASNYAPAFSPAVGVDPAKTRAVDLTMSPGCTVEGTVEDKSGVPLPGVFLDAESRKVSGAMLETSMDSASQAQSDMNGRFRLEHVPTGPVLIRAYDGANAVTTAKLQISDCSAIEPVKLAMSDGGGISGVVHLPDGAPLAGVRLSVSQRSLGFVSAVSDAEGRFRFDRLPPGVVRLEAQHEGKQAIMFMPVKDGEILERDVTLFGGGAGEVTGRVTAGGKPLGGARVMAVTNHGSETGVDTRHVTTAEDGSYRFSGLPDGHYMVQVVSTMSFASAHVVADKAATVDLDVAKRPVHDKPAVEESEP